ncbi:hydroxyethylthiazole kinase [Apilactobacillus sp. TMW 2.2459]|nr:hydroxyethylthiazole kinase [Apilactobacillus xinyiensis]
MKWNSKGIDAGNGDGNAVSIAKKAAKKLGCIVVVSGSTDIITDANETFLIHNNAPMLCTNVGMGDVLDAILSVFLSYNDSIKDIAYATAILPIAAEQATKEYNDKPASFCVKTFDNLYKMTDLTLEKYIKMVKI